MNPPQFKPDDSIRKRFIFPFLLATVAFLYLRTFTLGGIPLVVSQDGPIFLEHGLRILHGQLPFRDYPTFVMPGADLLYAGIFGLLGVHAWLPQAILILLGTTIAGVLLWVSAKVLQGALVFLPALLFLVLDFDVMKDVTHHWYCTLLVLVATGLLLGGKTRGRIVFAGALCGLGALFTQTQGLLSLIAIGAYLLWTRDRESRLAQQLTALLLPFAIIVGSVLAYYSYRVGFATMYFSLVTFPFHYFPKININAPGAYFMNFPTPHGLRELTRLVPYFFIHLLVPFGYLWCLFQLFRRENHIDRQTRDALLLINLIGLALFIAIAHAASYYRMCTVAPPAAIICVWLVRGGSTLDRVTRQVLWAVGLLFLVLFPFQLQRHWRGYLDLPTGRTAFFVPSDFERFQWFAQHTHPGESYIGQPAISFALKLDNPTSVDYINDSDYMTKEQVSDAIRAVRAHQTPMIVLMGSVAATEKFDPPPGHGNLAPFFVFLHANYHFTKVFAVKQHGDHSVWERNSDQAQKAE